MPPAAHVEAETPTSMTLPRLQSALRAFQSSGRAFELIGAAAAPRRCGTLVVLDSSFNPPTIAHMRMATSALQELHTQKDIAATLRGGAADERDGGVRLLLLLAVNNADKAPKPASFEQRLLMMGAFAGDIQRAWREAQAQQRQDQLQHPEGEDDLPVDIGLTTHPYFHDKSSAIAASPAYDFSPSHPTSSSPSSSSPEMPATEQIFLAGFDTLIRIFNPKYYTPPVPEQGVTPGGSSDKTPMQAALGPFLARARLRITMRTDADWGGREEQVAYVERLLHGDELERVGGRKEWARRVQMVEGTDGGDGLVLSSTEARASVKDGDWGRLRRLVPEGVAGLIEGGEVSW